MSKMAAADYLGISRSTFDNRVHDGYLPKGKVQYGFKELSWNKIDLDLYKCKQICSVFSYINHNSL